MLQPLLHNTQPLLPKECQCIDFYLDPFALMADPFSDINEVYERMDGETRSRWIYTLSISFEQVHVHNYMYDLYYDATRSQKLT